jgi:hypothetical protein
LEEFEKELFEKFNVTFLEEVKKLGFDPDKSLKEILKKEYGLSEAKIKKLTQIPLV